MTIDRELYDIQAKVALKEAREAIERLEKANEILVEENLKLITEINDSKENRASEIREAQIKMLEGVFIKIKLNDYKHEDNAHYKCGAMDAKSDALREVHKLISELKEEGKEKGKV